MKTTLIFALMAILTITACKKDLEIESAPAPDPKVSLSELGYLRFKDQATFKETIEGLKKMTTQELEKWESEKGISSLRKKFADLGETDETQPNPVDVPHFAAIINKDGVFAIGDQILEFATKHNIYQRRYKL